MRTGVYGSGFAQDDDLPSDETYITVNAHTRVKRPDPCDETIRPHTS